MDTKHIYELHKNLDLKDEHFIVKKGTQFEIVDVLISKNEKSLTKLLIKFSGINGTYSLNEKDFDTLLSKTELQLRFKSKFIVNDCVVHSTHGKGTVAKVEYDFILKTFIYKVQFAIGERVVRESTLSGCN
jgi:hypothetical protein